MRRRQAEPGLVVDNFKALALAAVKLSDSILRGVCNFNVSLGAGDLAWAVTEGRERGMEGHVFVCLTTSKHLKTEDSASNPAS